nr:restriction endonuclease subunit S [Mycoplasmopsis bovis]
MLPKFDKFIHFWVNACCKKKAIISFFNQCFRFWEQKKLRNVVSYHSSMMIASDVKKYGKFDVYDPNKIVGKTDAEPFRSDYISIVKDGDAGRIRLLPKNTMILSTMGALIAKDPFKIDFLYYMLNAINDLSRERNGSIIPHIYFKDYGQNIYNLPSIPEQSKISSLFTYLDSLITLHQRKLSSLKNLKNRLLDRMFCDEKSQFPSIRFTEFTNAWEQWKVGDLITERIEFTKESNEFPLMAFVANEGVVAKGERYDRSSLVRDIYNKIYKVTKYGDFIYSSNNLDRGSIGANKYGNACISPVYSIFKCTNSSDHNFIKNILSRHSFVNKLLKYRQGVVYGQLKIHESIFLNINLNSPSILEQNKIGKIFYNLDSLITLHQRKLLSLKNLKSRLLDRMFCDEKSQFPSIRFKEFTNVWEQKKLRNVVSYHSSVMIASDVKKYGKFDVYDPNKIVGKTDAEPFRSDYISIVKDGDAGRIRLLPKNTMILSTMGALIAKDPFKIDFLYYMLNAINDLARERNGSIIPHIYFKDYGQNIYNLPSTPEQSKISSLFTRLDSLITLHQRKLLSLKNLKSRLLDRMFCDEKSQFPSIRFKEFTNTWEQGKLGNLIDKGGSGGTPNTSNAKFYNGSIPFLTIADLTKADGHIYSTEKHITNEGLNSSSAWIVPKGSLTLSIYATIGKIGIMHQNMATSQAFYSMVINDDITKKYLYYHLKKSDVFGEWTKLISTGTQANLNSEKVKSFGIFIPKNKSEQSKISSLFTHLDSLITLHQRG